MAELVIEELEIGDGDEAVAGKNVSVHYTGTLEDGVGLYARELLEGGGGDQMEGRTVKECLEVGLPDKGFSLTLAKVRWKFVSDRLICSGFSNGHSPAQ